MVAVTYPGVYIQEVSSGVQTITGVSTSTAMFIGRTERGVIDKPTQVFNLGDFNREYGSSTSMSELAGAVRLFFTNGGTRAYIMRIAEGADVASVTLKNGAQNVLKLTAREAGVRGNELRVVVDYNTLDPDNTFNLGIFRQGATLQETELETHNNLSMEPGSPRYVVDIIDQDSKLVTATKEGIASILHGDSIGAIVGDGDGDATAVQALLGASAKLSVSIDGGPAQPITVSAGNIAAGIALAGLDDDIEYIPLITDDIFLVQIKRKAAGSVQVLVSDDESDVATKLQMGPERGGIERRLHSDQRPLPSGIVTALPDANLGKFAALLQANYTATDISIGAVTVPDINLKTTGTAFYDGPVSPVPSLKNVAEVLTRFASQFNAKAQNIANFNWRVERQGLRLVYRPTAGDANTGLGTTPTSPATNFIHAMNGFVVTPNNTRYYSLNNTGGGGFQSGTNGDDGDVPGPQQYAAAYEIIDRDVDVFNILILPRDAGMLEIDRAALWGPASVFCQQRRAFLLVDPPRTWQSIADVTAGIGSLRTGLVKDHSGVYWPFLTMRNEVNLSKTVDASGAIAGIMARIDGSRGVWKAPAGLEADIRGVTGTSRRLSDPENGVLNPLGINAVRVFPNGIISWGARTVDGFDNSGNSQTNYVPVRRLMLFLEESLRRGLQFAVFEPNDEPLWAQIRLAAGAFMNGLFRQGAFQGQKKSEAYFVKVDAETTTQNDINLGIVNVIVGFAPLKPAEFVIIQLKQIAGQIQT